jgi:uncharacterized protein
MKTEYQFFLPYNHSRAQFLAQLQALGITGNDPYYIVKKSLDARKKKNIRWIYAVSTRDPRSLLKRDFPKIPSPAMKPVIVGTGPAGLFTAYWLLQYGVTPVLLEQGAPLEERTSKIAAFIRKGILDETTNICFGAGGAGAWSDGKLFTRIRSPWVSTILDTFIRFGALEEIRYLANPHLGSDKIRPVVQKLFRYLKEKGADIRFHTRVLDFHVKNKQIRSVLTTRGEIETDTVFLAAGHSSRNLYEVLSRYQALEFKPFAVGLRMVHPARVINRIQYGEECFSLGPAMYRLTHTWDHPEKRGVYTFCMCPGGYVLNASTDHNGVACNGMSNYSKASGFSNSAVVVNIAPEDLQGDPVMKGLAFQEKLEEHFAQQANPKKGVQALPAMRLMDFLKQTPSHALPAAGCFYPLTSSPLYESFPDFINQALVNGLEIFNRKMKGLIHPEGVLIGVESRTSSPLRITRDPVSFQSPQITGLYPLGEGAGYAGGIVSAAADGITGAQTYIQVLSRGNMGIDMP